MMNTSTTTRGKSSTTTTTATMTLAIDAPKRVCPPSQLAGLAKGRAIAAANREARKAAAEEAAKAKGTKTPPETRAKRVVYDLAPVPARGKNPTALAEVDPCVRQHMEYTEAVKDAVTDIIAKKAGIGRQKAVAILFGLLGGILEKAQYADTFPRNVSKGTEEISDYIYTRAARMDWACEVMKLKAGVVAWD